MAEEHVFETTVEYPADPAQKVPPDPAFSRDNRMRGSGAHPELPGALPPALGGHDRGYSPEDLLILSLSECHLLTYLYLAQRKGIAIRRYQDRATGRLGKNAAGQTQMLEVVLRPRVTVPRGTDPAAVNALHERAHHYCFIANSVNFPVRHEPEAVEE
ncbi:MAG TPA: OsmC family protein [Usitatibacter sp.]|nr:OsmC family protein [Usitatibacter sp.]